jgi:hypothetical protein
LVSIELLDLDVAFIPEIFFDLVDGGIVDGFDCVAVELGVAEL